MLKDLQFSLPDPDGDDYVFGLSDVDEVFVPTGGWDPGSVTMVTQDTQPAGSDGVMVGVDTLAPQTWLFSVMVDRRGDVTGALGRLAWVWRADKVRRTPGAVLPLTYSRLRQRRMVWGRPRDFTIKPPEVWSDDYAFASMSFALTDPTVYDAREWTRTLTLGTPPPDIGVYWGELDIPLTLPAQAPPRQGQIIAGTSSAPFTVTFVGDPGLPTTGLQLAGDDWVIALDGALDPGASVTVDTRAATTTAPVTFDSTLNARLPGGETELVLTADHVTGARAVLAWHPGFASI